ncbi:MAG: hypothetical protein J6Y20_14800 [Lachnospiraceae bacterium]|nr:hypothetical protein [Lachnospiraceae bacterium]
MFDITAWARPKVCKECGEPVVEGSRTYLCRRCTARLSARVRRAERRAQGVCWRCGTELHDNHKQCEACRAKRRAAKKRREGK